MKYFINYYLDIILKLALSAERHGSHDLAIKYLAAGLHAIQDSCAHFNSGISHKGVMDDPKWRPTRYSDAKKATKTYLEQYTAATKL